MVTEGKLVKAHYSLVKEDVVVINFNDPLAGKTLPFEVEIIDVNQSE